MRSVWLNMAEFVLRRLTCFILILICFIWLGILFVKEFKRILVVFEYSEIQKDNHQGKGQSETTKCIAEV